METKIKFKGHPNIRAEHGKTLEITRDPDLSAKGDCIVGILAEKACSDLDPQLKRVLQQDRSYVRVRIIVDDETFTLRAFGSGNLIMSDPRDIVIRKTNFTNCRRTIAVRADAAAVDMPRAMVRGLQSGAVGYMVIETFPPKLVLSQSPAPKVLH